MTDIPSFSITVRPTKAVRKRNAEYGWPNWYINRGRMSLNFTGADMRRVSWRRAL